MGTRGAARKESDLDVCVMVDRSIVDVAFQIGFEHDIAISTVTYSRHEF